MKKRKIILLGKTGDGKSSAGNTILGQHAFTTKASANSITNKSVSAEGMVDGRKITVIDTPGFIDTDHDDMKIKSEIMKAVIDSAPDIDAFVIVLKVGRYTRHENKVVQKLLDTFKEEHILKHTVILFTFGEQLEGQSIEEFVKTSSQLQELVNKCEGRCHVIDNKYWNNCHSGFKSNRVQVKNMLKTIDKIVKENGCYSNKLLQMVEEKIQEEMKINKYNLPPEVNRKKAKKTVHKKILEQVAGAATGILVGALLGAGVALASVVSVVRWVSAEVVAGAAAEIGAGGAGISACTITAGVLGPVAGAIVGAVGGGVTGWKVAEDADSVCDAIKKAATATYEIAKEFAAFNLNTKNKYI